MTKKTRKITYYDNSHFAVLTQMHGSVWPKVLPYCLVNMLLTYLIFYLKGRGIDLTFSGTGHTFMSIMVSFLVVSRSQIVYTRYMDARASLATIFRSSREIIQHTCVITGHRKDEEAKLWREEIAFRTITLLRIAMKVLGFRSTNVDCWIGEGKDVRKNIDKNLEHHPIKQGLPANIRAPIILAYHLRKKILCQRTGAFKNERRMHINEELKVLQYVGQFVQAWAGLTKLMTTPYPFPLVQMGRTFLFFWVYSLPFVLSSDKQEDVVQIIILLGFLTYGFMGIESVSMELDDPFGDDPNDFDDEYLSRVAIDDILILMSKTDGRQAEENLKNRCRLVSNDDLSVHTATASFYDSVSGV